MSSHATQQFEGRNRLRAQQVILEMANQSPDNKIEGKARLFKIFYLAHLYYAYDEVGFLSEWPIVKMPEGPGIDRLNHLLHDLLTQKMLETTPIRIGPYPAMCYRATGKAWPGAPLEREAVEAIRQAVKFARNKTGAQLSDLTHEYSYSWNEAESGMELNIYLDLLSEEERKQAKQTASEVQASVEEAWE